MRWLVASDIHGSAFWCRKLEQVFRNEGASRILLLGDILYHGPRNDLPMDYNPKQVISILNSLSDRVIAVRGNCDAEVDQMVLDFPIMADYAAVPFADNVIYATHGHLFNADNPPKLRKGDVLLHGHTHIPCFENHDGVHVVNPGSVAIPKGSSTNSYMLMDILDDRLSFTLRDFDANTIASDCILY